jgi:opacity protein-like surface antigen
MRNVALFVFFTIWSFGANAQWRWFLQAEVGANKQEIQGAYQLAQQPFDPQAFWRATAGGEVQVGYTVLKVLTAYSGLGYGHQNVAYQSTEWATDDAGQPFLLLCQKTATGELLTLPMGLELKVLSVHVGGGLQYRYRIQGTMQKDFYAFYPGAPSTNLLSSEVAQNTQEKFDMGYFAYLQWNPTKRIGLRASAYRGFRDLSNGLEVGAFNEWQQLFNTESFSIKNLQFNLGLNIRLSE